MGFWLAVAGGGLTLASLRLAVHLDWWFALVTGAALAAAALRSLLRRTPRTSIPSWVVAWVAVLASLGTPRARGQYLAGVALALVSIFLVQVRGRSIWFLRALAVLIAAYAVAKVVRG